MFSQIINVVSQRDANDAYVSESVYNDRYYKITDNCTVLIQADIRQTRRGIWLNMRMLQVNNFIESVCSLFAFVMHHILTIFS